MAALSEMAFPAKAIAARRHAASHSPATGRSAAARSLASKLPSRAAVPLCQAPPIFSPPQTATGIRSRREDDGEMSPPMLPPSRAKSRLAFCRLCGSECREWELQMHLCPDCALERVLSGVPLSGRQMSVAGRRQAEADAQATCSSGGAKGRGSRLHRQKRGAAPRVEVEEEAPLGSPPAKHRRIDGTGRRVGGNASDLVAPADASPRRSLHPPPVTAVSDGVSDQSLVASRLERPAPQSAADRLQSFLKLRAAADARLAQQAGEGGEAGLVWMTAEAAGVLDLLRCSVCLGYLDRTLVAPCMHRFCAPCVEKWLRMGRHDCPECKTPIHTRRSFRCAPTLRDRLRSVRPLATGADTTLFTPTGAEFLYSLSADPRHTQDSWCCTPPTPHAPRTPQPKCPTISWQ